MGNSEISLTIENNPALTRNRQLTSRLSRLQVEYFKTFRPLSLLFLICGFHLEIGTPFGQVRKIIGKITTFIFILFILIAIICTVSSARLVVNDDFTFNFVTNLNCVLGVVYGVLLYKRLSRLKNILPQVWKIYSPFCDKRYLRKLHKYTVAACLFSLAIPFVTSHNLTINFMAPEYSLGYFYHRFTFNIEPTFAKYDATLGIICLTYEIQYTWVNCFVIYYCLICCLLKATFCGYITAMKNTADFSMLLLWHNTITRFFSEYDDALSNQVF